MKAPTTTVSPDTATGSPNPSPLAASEANRWACSAQADPERSNTYAEPAKPPAPGVASRGAPTTVVSPDTATDQPKRSLPAGSEANRWACSAQVEPVRTNTYAEPAAF